MLPKIGLGLMLALLYDGDHRTVARPRLTMQDLNKKETKFARPLRLALVVISNSDMSVRYSYIWF